MSPALPHAFAALDTAATGTLLPSDGVPLFYRDWRPDDPERGTLVCAHGVQSHSGWYGWSSARLRDAGWRVLFPDRRGSGENRARPGHPRGHARHADRLLADLRLAVAHARETAADPRAPLVLCGISWGGKLAAVLAGEEPGACDGLVLMYPGLCPRVRPNAVQAAALRAAAWWGATRRAVRIPLDDPRLFTRTPGFVEFVRDDPLALREATVGFLAASIALDRRVSAAVRGLRVPTLALLAGRDEIIDNCATRRLLATAPAGPTVIEYPDARHTLEFEPGRDAIYADVADWLGRFDP